MLLHRTVFLQTVAPLENKYNTEPYSGFGTGLKVNSVSPYGCIVARIVRRAVLLAATLRRPSHPVGTRPCRRERASRRA